MTESQPASPYVWALTLIFALVTVFGATLAHAEPGMRVWTFTGDNAWEAVETVYKTLPNGRFATERIGAQIRSSTNRCEDLLGVHQKRALDVMLANRYITQELFDALRDPKRRAHQMSQYVLATLYEDLSEAEIKAKNIPDERILEDVPESHPPLKRVHIGTMFAVRGYDLAQPKGTVPRNLPFEIGKLPDTLKKTLDRTNMPLAVELGRTLIEPGGSRHDIKKLMQLMASVLAADARVLNVAPASIPLFAHALDSAHARLFAATFQAQPMTPDMQSEIEANPTQALQRIGALAQPGREEWAKFNDAVLVGSLEKLLRQYPAATLSEGAARLRAVYPAISEEQALAIVQEVHAAVRQDFDFMWHDEKRPGHRAPVHWRDFGTGLMQLRIGRILQRHGFPSDPEILNRGLHALDNDLQSDPDFGQTDWTEKSMYLPFEKFPSAGEDLPQAIVISNLDPTVPSREMPAYLGKILISVAAKIRLRLKGLKDWERVHLVENMNQKRARRNLFPITEPQLNLASFLETYELFFATGNAGLADHLKMLGADIRHGLRVDMPFSSGDMKFGLDFDKLGIDPVQYQLNPARFQARLEQAATAALMNSLLSIFQPTRLYQFNFDEVREQEIELQDTFLMGAEKVLQPANHDAKIRRLFITYQ